ncbi:hypothetical protein TELCIR_24156 [Teladorsagia circumcincta]|uniref:DDE-1 domain-containing protein n=1 Tax=Teladorsagia circumcincta TaxID=45464 RepID=A0A2G9TAS1_TELCI|nr:hypothetical protein TELCIR_24156 [Teladorsagia circumcincta]
MCQLLQPVPTSKFCGGPLCSCRRKKVQAPSRACFKRKTLPKEPFNENVILNANDKGWMNENLMKGWIDEIWLQRPNASTQQGSSALILDAASFHQTEVTTEVTKPCLQQYSRIIMIPGGITKLLKPLDISVNKSFKSNTRKCREN